MGPQKFAGKKGRKRAWEGKCVWFSKKSRKKEKKREKKKAKCGCKKAGVPIQ